MTCQIKGLGTALPARSGSQASAFDVACQLAPLTDRQVRSLRVLYRRTTVEKRHSVLISESGSVADYYPPFQQAGDCGPTTRRRMERYAQEVVPLAMRACRQALEESGMQAGELTDLITVSCTGFFSPGLDAAIIDCLKLPPSVSRTNIGFMGCHGALNAMRVALMAARAYPQSRILICCAELCSLHFQYGWQPGTAVANALFADGAAAMIGQYAAESGEDEWAVLDCASLLLPDSDQDMTWRIGDHGFEMTLSDRVPDLIERHVAGWIQDWLGSHGLSVSSIGSWAVHPGGPSILDAVAASLGLSDSALEISRQVLAEHGNMSSPTVLFILDRLRSTGAKKPCVMMAFGPGLVAEAALLV
jgi:predicted naringenin-chalcone synthase